MSRFFQQNFVCQRKWHNILKVLKEKPSNQEYSTQQTSYSELERKEFSIKEKLKEFITTKQDFNKKC